LIAPGGEVVGGILEFIEVGIARCLDHDLEAAGIPEPAYSRRAEGEYAGVGDFFRQPLADLCQDRLAAARRVVTLRERFENHESGSIIRADCIGDERLTRNAQHMSTPGICDVICCT